MTVTLSYTSGTPASETWKNVTSFAAAGGQLTVVQSRPDGGTTTTVVPLVGTTWKVEATQ